MIHCTRPLYLLFAISLLCFVSCDEDNPSGHLKDCQFVNDPSSNDGAIDAVERKIMDECRDAFLYNPEEYEDNFIGEWQLVGYGNGWRHQASQPCAFLRATSNSAILEYTSGAIDTITEHFWQIAVSPDGTPSVVFDPNLELVVFGAMCSDYAFSDATPLDGNMYLFEKIN